MRTQVTKEEKKTFTFVMTDQDILERVSYINRLKDQELDLERKKKAVSQEIKAVVNEMDQIFSNIARREEDKEVDCIITMDYETKTVTVVGPDKKELEHRKMTDWEYNTRPSDIFPEKKLEDKVAEKVAEKMTGTIEKAFQEAEKRKEEIAEKSENIVAPSANVNQFSEAKTEISVDYSA